MVLPSVSLRVLIGESAFAYQKRSLAPVVSAPMTRTGAPLENAPMTPITPVMLVTIGPGHRNHDFDEIFQDCFGIPPHKGLDNADPERASAILRDRCGAT